MFVAEKEMPIWYILHQMVRFPLKYPMTDYLNTYIGETRIHVTATSISNPGKCYYINDSTLKQGMLI